MSDPWKIKIELADGIDSLSAFTDFDGMLIPQRRVLHELIAQTVSERKFSSANGKHEKDLEKIVADVRQTSSFKALEVDRNSDPNKISAILDEIGLERLPTHDRAEQVMMVTGGPGTGKTKLTKKLNFKTPDIYQNAVQINPDHYKDLLANSDELGAKHATFTHYESSMIADDIMGRLDAKMRAGLPAPHVLMDVAAPYPNRMEFAKQFGQMTVITGTAPPEITVQRAYNRGFDKAGDVIDRVTPTNFVLNGAAKSSELLPNVFEHPNLYFQMVGMDVGLNAPPDMVADWNNDTRTLVVTDTDQFLDFIERQDINDLADSPEKLFAGTDRSAHAMAARLKPYTDQNIQIDFLNEDKRVALSLSQKEVNQNVDLSSRRGGAFMHDMAESFGKLGKNGGVIAGVTLGTLSGVFTALATGDAEAGIKTAYENAVPYGETQIDLAKGDLQAAQKSATIETVSNVGSVGGALAGAAWGTAILPGVGTIAGGAIGGITGALAVGIGAGYIAERVYDNFSAIKGHIMEVSKFAADSLGVAIKDVKQSIQSSFSGGGNIDISAVLNGLPDNVSEDMPPEVQALVNVKGVEDLFAETFNELQAQGSLAEVVSYMQDQNAANDANHAQDIAKPEVLPLARISHFEPN